jgi:hypothetical protein
MPAFKHGSDFELCPAGDQLLRVTGFDVNAVDKDGKPAVKWEWSTVDAHDSSGFPFKIRKQTGQNIDESLSSWAAQLLKAHFPDYTFDELIAVEPEEVIGKMVVAPIFHQTTAKGTFASFINDSLRPFGGKAPAEKKKGPVVTPKEELPSKVDDEDPFEVEW